MGAGCQKGSYPGGIRNGWDQVLVGSRSGARDCLFARVYLYGEFYRKVIHLPSRELYSFIFVFGVCSDET